MLETKTKIWRIGSTIVLTLPSKIVDDSTFPFNIEGIREDKEEKESSNLDVNVRIDNKRLVIEKIKEATKK